MNPWEVAVVVSVAAFVLLGIAGIVISWLIGVLWP
jgi:VIT1/CCC1 family predicted Fe2+/Mn2+ transporter